MPSPEEFVLDYLNTRYTDTDYTNIEEKAELQKVFLADELIESDFKFGKFNEEISYFAQNKFKIENPQFNIYNVTKSSTQFKVFVTVYFNVTSDTSPMWSQFSYYDLQFIIEKLNEEFVIKYIIILSKKYQTPDSISHNNYNHEEH